MMIFGDRSLLYYAVVLAILAVIVGYLGFGGLAGAMGQIAHILFFVFILLFIFGFSFGVEVIVFAIGRELSLKSAAGTAVAFTNMLVMLGGAIFQPLIGALVDHFAGANLENAKAVVYGAHAYTMAMLVLPAVLVIALALILLLKETHAKLSYQH